MSAGFRIGLTDRCWNEPLETRLQVLQAVVKETGMSLLREFLHPKDLLEPRDLHDRASFRAVEVTPQEWRWLDEAETQGLREAVGNRWSDGASYEDCYLLCDEETSLVLPRVDRSRLGSNGKRLIEWPGTGERLVVAETGAVLERLHERIADPELQLSEATLGVLRTGAETLQLCLDHSLAFSFYWGG